MPIDEVSISDASPGVTQRVDPTSPATEWTLEKAVALLTLLAGGRGAGGDPIDRSGSISTGGTWQQLAGGLAGRLYIEIQNISDETMYINFGGEARTDANSFKLVAGSTYVNPPQFCPTGIVAILGATTGKKFVAKEF